MRSLGRLTDARSAYQNALAIDANYNPQIIYALAILEKELKNYVGAIKLFEQFANMPKTSPELAEKAKAQAAECKQLQANPNMEIASKSTPVPESKKPVVLMTKPQVMSDNINSASQSQYFPSLTADGEMLFFTRNIGSSFMLNEDFFMSKKVNGEWQMAQPVNELNTKLSEGAQCISADGTTFLFTACSREDGLGSCDLYITSFKNGNWGTPVNMKELNTSSWDGTPSMSGDKKLIFFSSDRPGGKGGRDIWYSRNINGKWAEPKPLGGNINTDSHEDAPFFHPDGQTLYFTSYGHDAKGRDIFVSRRVNDSTWTDPINMGEPFNTDRDEWSPSVSLDGSTLFFTRSDDGVIKIYYYTLQNVKNEAVKPKQVTYLKATVRDAVTKTPLSSRLQIMDSDAGTVIQTGETDNSGTFIIPLPFGKRYALSVNQTGYVFFKQNFNLTQNASADKPFILDIELKPLKEAAATPENNSGITLHDLNFALASSEPLPESMGELEQLYGLMNTNTSLKIAIHGHTDNSGSAESNVTLSQKRAEAVKKFLTDKGIAADRISCKGFGEKKPIDTNETEEGRARNRRTEFVVVSY